MTRIFTNVPAMIARANLNQNMNALQTSLERLSTGFKINSGKDDPAGLIASEMLRSDVTGIRVAIKNTERANMMIATADSALNEVTNLLNDIRGLITEAANTGAMSREMIEANQLQIDASLDAIDRIAAQTTFMGQKLLDGSLDFNYAGVDRNNLRGLAVHQVTFGANKAPTEVVISVREAAEKAALYFNQPALSESIVLRWGGNYGFDMETFEKGATVAEIAEIVNKRADGTGVIAEVGSDAIAGLLYVSSLGHDNDMIIRAGLEGLNAGNVQIKYLKGSSEGIQVRYQEPIAPGAPATILVYLQTEAFNAAFADDIDTTWTYENGKLVPLRDNNALKFEANIEGAQYNGANIFYVDGNTDPRFFGLDNPTGTPGMPFAHFSDNGQSSVALFGFVPGTDPTTGVNNTALAFNGLSPGEYFAVQSRAAGSTYNNVNIQFVAAAAGDPMLSGRNAAAVYSEHGGKTLTIYYNNNGQTTLQDIQDALRVERHVDAQGNVVTGAFEIKPQIGGKPLSEVTLQARTAGSTTSSNTHNSGGAAGSLFIVMPPDGKMPARADVPERPGVTARAVADGFHLAHSSPEWSNITFEFSKTGVYDRNVAITYTNNGSERIAISVGELATYDDILRALNNDTPNVPGPGAWGGTKPDSLRNNPVYWSDAAGNAVTPSVPRGLATSDVWSGVTGISTSRVATVNGENIFLRHDITSLDNLMIEFRPTDVLPAGTHATATLAPGGSTLIVNYSNTADFNHILDALNLYAHTTYGGSASPPITPFSWVNERGASIVAGTLATPASTTTLYPIDSGTVEATTRIPVGDRFSLSHTNPAWDDYSFRFVRDDAFGGKVDILRTGNEITVRVDNDTTYDDILSALNRPSAWWGGPLPTGIVDVTGTPPPNPGATENRDGFWWVDTERIPVIPGVPMALTQSTNSGTYRPHQYSPDVRSTHVGDGLYLQHTNAWWDDVNITFVTNTATTVPPGNALEILFDGSTVTVKAGENVTYDTILAYLNAPQGGPGSPPVPPWTLVNGATSFMLDRVPENSLRWVTVNGETNPTSAQLGSLNLRITHSDPQWDRYEITFAQSTASDAATSNGVSVVANGNRLTVTYGGLATYDNILAALNGRWTDKPSGMGMLRWEPNDTSTPMQNTGATFASTITGITLGAVTASTAGQAPTSALHNRTVTMGALSRDITANDIAAIFDLNSHLSRGSERAASLFTVTTTVDNDGTGPIRLFDYWITYEGEMINADDLRVRDWNPHDPNSFPPGATFVKTVTAFENAFGGGKTGGNVVTTAAELVTALNNSAFWGMMMCPEMIAELARENVLGRYFDANDPPVITAQLAPGNHGLFAVTTFEEVAYYGDPNDGTALQFLGGHNSPNVRFVAGPPNSQLSLDRTTVPAVEGNAQAVLTAQDGGASLTITSVKRGAEYDDVQFVFKRVGEDAQGVLAPDRRDGWVEYDPGTSRAFAQATFRDAITNQPVANTAFFITATERGDMFNNVDIMMRLDDAHTSPDPVVVTFDPRTNQLRVSINSLRANDVTTNDIIAAINKANVGFTAELSYAEDPANNGRGTFGNVGLSSARQTVIASTGDTGGRKGGTVTVWLAAENDGPGGPGSATTYRNPTQEDVVRLINNDPVVGGLFVARAFNSVQQTDGKVIDFVKDGPLVTSGGLVQPAVITVQLATDSAGNVTTTAAQFAEWWNKQDPALIDNISVSIVRPAGASWDECGDPYGNGVLAPTVRRGDCDEWIINDIMFVGWNDSSEKQHYVARHSSGVMTSQRGIDSSFQLVARNLGPQWDGFFIEYVQDNSLSGLFADNLVSGSANNPCLNDPYFGIPRDDCGNPITPNSMTENGLRLEFDPVTKRIRIHVNFANTTANDIQQLINSDPRTRNLFQVIQLGDGTGRITADDGMRTTTGGALPPGELNGAKLLFGSDATDYYLIFRSSEYGSDQFVTVFADHPDRNNPAPITFALSDSAGNRAETAHGKDVDALVNGVRASAKGLDVSLNTSSLSMTFSFSELAGTMVGYSTNFWINGGGATFQVGPDVVSRQQISLGIRSINTVMLGGPTGVLNQLRSGQDASLDPVKGDTNKAFRIVQESLLAITAIRGRLGTMQRATLETNINVLNDTLSALMEAESQIRDTDFAEETSNLTRAQILVQANMNTLGIANQIPNYMLSLLGR